MFAFIYSFFVVIWELLCCEVFLGIFVEKKTYTKRYIVPIINLLLLICYYATALLLCNYLWAKQIGIIFVTSFFMFFLFKTIYIKLFPMIVLFQGILMLTDYGTILIAGKVLSRYGNDIFSMPNISILITIIARLILLGIVLIIKQRIDYKAGNILSIGEWLKIIVIPVVTIICIVIFIKEFQILHNINQERALLYVALGMASINMVTFFLINDVTHREMKMREEKIFLEKAKNKTDMYHSVAQNLDKERKIVHEFKNQLACISALAKGGKIEKLNNYIEEIDNELKEMYEVIDTNNVIVNAILNVKYEEMCKKNIVFIIKINDLSMLCLPDVDIVILLSNLLNNAIEACELCENKLIKLKFVLEDNQIILSVENSAKKEPTIINGKFITSKNNQEKHGIGIDNIVATINKHCGKYIYEYKEEVFIFSIILPNRA